jgi:hypothetical protein
LTTGATGGQALVYGSRSSYETWSSRKSRKNSNRGEGLAGDYEVLELKMRGGLAGSLRRAHVEEQVWQESMKFRKKMGGGLAESPRRSLDDGNTIVLDRKEPFCGHACGGKGYWKDH